MDGSAVAPGRLQIGSGLLRTLGFLHASKFVRTSLHGRSCRLMCGEQSELLRLASAGIWHYCCASLVGTSSSY
jgi:hypothetical protein